MQDHFLEGLISLVHNSPITFDITLTTPGGLIRGTLISTKEYFDRFAESFASAWPGEGGDVLRKSFNQWGGQRSVEGGFDAFVHLKNAHYLDGSGMFPVGPGVLWRGRVAEVSGYTLGQG
ncbi:hypothetical protein IRZ59_00260 [Pseudomonas guariconensis]|uniref:hypothetical protein n=1 Tax=Pseudomonas guariconensis TaxID=1288410 RepID=UPI0018AAE7CC|nr:hypothetical protein [Pseudomonas guariconensis]MBF8728869.1 hypothetical protein [Pseudomonas guariconensis]